MYLGRFPHSDHPESMLRARVAPLHAVDVGLIVTIAVAKLQLAADTQQLNQSQQLSQSNQMFIHPDSFLEAGSQKEPTLLSDPEQPFDAEC